MTELLLWNYLELILSVIALVIILLVGVPRCVGELRRLRKSEKDAGIAKKIIERNDHSGEPIPEARAFCLYLRPFVVDDTIHSLHPKSVKRNEEEHLKKYWAFTWWRLAIPIDPSIIPAVGSMFDPPRPDLAFETSLWRAFERRGLLTIALGLPGEFEGLPRGRISAETWRRKVSRLLDEARVVVCIPSGSEGMLWEIREILNRRYIEKTIFVWPAGSSVHRPDEEATSRAQSQWSEECRKRYESIWISIPELAPPAVDPTWSFYFTYKYSEGCAESGVVLSQATYWLGSSSEGFADTIADAVLLPRNRQTPAPS